MKKIILVLGAAVIIASPFTSCDKQTPVNPQNPSGTTGLIVRHAQDPYAQFLVDHPNLSLVTRQDMISIPDREIHKRIFQILPNETKASIWKDKMDNVLNNAPL